MKYLLIDGNNLACRCVFANAELKNSDNISTSLHYGFFNSLIALKQIFPDHQLLISWDGHSDRRKNESKLGVEQGIIKSGYKANRDKENLPQPLKDFHAQAPFLKRAIEQTGIPQIRIPNQETDDIINTYCKKLGKDNEIICVSGDEDFYQLLDDHVSIWNGGKSKMITKEEWTKEYGITPEQHVHVGALTGDTCLSGDTKIPLLNGTEKTMRELSNSTKPFWVFSCSIDGEIIPAKASCHLISPSAPCVKVLLDSGEEIICTKEHKFMMKDGSFQTAESLVTGCSLMPLYKRTYLNPKSKNEYLEAFDNKSKKWNKIHVLVAKNIFKKEYDDISKICIEKRKTYRGRCCPVVHHLDFNSKNNDPSNLRWMEFQDHIKYHGSLNKSNWLRPEYREKMKGVCSRAGKIGGKVTWQRHRKKMLSVVAKIGKVTGPRNLTIYNKSDANKPKASQNIKRYLLLPEFAEKRSNAAKKRANTKSYRENMARVAKKYTPILNKDKDQIEKQWLGKVEKTAQEAFREYGVINKETYQKFVKGGGISWDKAVEKYGIEKINKLCEKVTDLRYKNHKVVGVSFFGKTDVYDLHVEPNSNFAISAGIFVHNCDNIFGLTGWGEKTALEAIQKYGSWENLYKYYHETYGHLRKQFPDLNPEEFKKLESITTKSGKPKYPEITINSPYTGVTLAVEEKRTGNISKSILMALMFEERVKLAYSLKKMDVIPDLPDIVQGKLNEQKLVEYFDYYDIISLKDSICIFK